ncbi:hypothetical protein GGI03_000901 [Coemansia sp. RSA 2337]|nr:hypothetical protein H4S03_001244 [Coemansia sp. S3946]KAJ2052563.1 hypothetical protein H4S04_001259 [Coemansia sp. S16]KAJ2069535.1 hypothetical protein GGI08_000303 [Coemansia sp. S2]KAJ2115413.1 hypothetical protein IW146_002330 [Coemansia sp. RSA 922]KAJ2468584.1 hypothetical protein GGI03_000901 [Coemansia sp. RSA 2337]
MNTLSAFQLLPPHIVRKIVDHVAGSSRVYYDGVRNEHDVHSELQMPLLWVCHNLRDFVFKRFCKFYALNLHEVWDKAVVTCQLWPKRLEKVDHARNHFAKELTISLGSCDIYSGKSLKQLSSGLHVGCAFPSVRKLSFHFITDDVVDMARDEFPPDSTANIAEFFGRIKEMAPMVKEVRVVNDRELDYLFQRQGAQFMNLVQQLFGVVETTVISDASPLLLSFMDLELARNLVCFDFWMDRNADEILSLIRQNAQTLQTLGIVVYIDTDFTSLFRIPDDGGYLAYPCLHTLKLVSLEGLLSSQLSTRKGVVPFPRLRNLVLSMVYPFGDDVLFRGNATTLEYVKLMPRTQLVEVLKQYEVFTPTSHPRLQCVVFDKLSDPLSYVFGSNDGYLQFVLSIASGASVRVIPNLYWYIKEVPYALSMLYNHVSIQVLSIPDVQMSIWDAIALIESLPLLSDLCAMAPTLGELTRCIKEDRLPDYVRETYGLKANRFRCWRITGNCNHRELATCMLLLALVCPNFDYAAVDRGQRRHFMEVMEEMINEPGFRQDTPRLRRLLFNGWNNKQD